MTIISFLSSFYVWLACLIQINPKNINEPNTIYHYYHTGGTYFRIDNILSPSAACITGGDTYCTYYTNNLGNRPPSSFHDHRIPSGVTLIGEGKGYDYVDED